MTHESEVYAKEIRRLKERVNTLIDVIEYAYDHCYDPHEWINEKYNEIERLDKETLIEYTET